MSYDNLVTSKNILGYGMKLESYEPDSPKIGNASKSSFTTALNA